MYLIWYESDCKRTSSNLNPWNTLSILYGTTLDLHYTLYINNNNYDNQDLDLLHIINLNKIHKIGRRV